jgi:hypothetical protein
MAARQQKLVCSSNHVIRLALRLSCIPSSPKQMIASLSRIKPLPLGSTKSDGDEFSTPGKATSIDVVLPANSYSGATKR